MNDQCPVCHAVSPLSLEKDNPEPGWPLLCPQCGSVVTRDVSGVIREPLIKEMLVWSQETHEMVSAAQEAIKNGEVK